MTAFERAAIPLSVPHQVGGELDAVARVLESNWLASVGPETDGFEADFVQAIGGRAALATSSGTAALHLALRVLGVGPGDEVLVSTLTFCASVNPIHRRHVVPVCGCDAWLVPRSRWIVAARPHRVLSRWIVAASPHRALSASALCPPPVCSPQQPPASPAR